MNSPVQQLDLRTRAEEVWARYRADLDAVERELTANLTSEVALVGEVARYVLGGGGKRFRPLVLAASARLAGAAPDGQPCPEVATLGAVVEYIHTATLLHDDVVDDGDIRRGQSAARTLWGNAGSVLVGDYLYARALAMSVSLGRLPVVAALTSAVEEMSEGEVFQLSVCGDAGLAEAAYLRIVELKTASLIRTAAQVGGMLGQISETQLAALVEYGRLMGIAFQVADDALDYQGDAEVFGKALGGDLKDGKITLPLLYALTRCSGAERARLESIIAHDDVACGDDLAFVLRVMRDHGALEDAGNRAREFSARAGQVLCQAFPDGPHRAALLELAEYVVERDR
ncbi:MAG: polyprenyl synthetase family protein [Nitrospirota bacterium]|nr:polyprenyl synthetase family protein [Nitrospirota bacterium]